MNNTGYESADEADEPLSNQHHPAIITANLLIF